MKIKNAWNPRFDCNSFVENHLSVIFSLWDDDDYKTSSSRRAVLLALRKKKRDFTTRATPVETVYPRRSRKNRWSITAVTIGPSRARHANHIARCAHRHIHPTSILTVPDLSGRTPESNVGHGSRSPLVRAVDRNSSSLCANSALVYMRAI